MRRANPLRTLSRALRLLSHPLNRHRKAAAFHRWLSWKIAAAMIPGPVIFNFVDDSMLIVEPGLNAATCNLYTGIYEFCDMSFVLHFLRGNDVFVDVGANIGSYTVLATAVRGASSISIEPVPSAYTHLIRNISLNGIRDKVVAHNVGIGSIHGRLKFTSAGDSVNHVATEDEVGRTDIIEVDVRKLDEIVGASQPILIKIDVEGYEAEVIEGAGDTLADGSLMAVIMELNGSSTRYGYDEVALHKRMLDYGFESFAYSPFDRLLRRLCGKNTSDDNTLYIRDAERVQERLRTAPRSRVSGYEI
jgi:FkbM family methyltransferase